MAAILGSLQTLNLSSVRLLAVLPILTAALAVAVALLPAARRLVWPAVVLAAANVVLTPLTSGEWFYQHAEDASYARAVADGDFTGFDRLMAGHDPHLLPRMAAMAVALLVALVGVAVLRARANGGASVSRATWAAAAGLVLLAATVSLVQGVLLLV
jgi:uncharacterized membrane protein